MSNTIDSKSTRLSQCFSLPGLFFLFVVIGACYLIAGWDLTITVTCGAIIGIITSSIGILSRNSAPFQLSIRGILAFTSAIAFFVVWQQHWFLTSEAAIARIEGFGGKAVVDESPGSPPKSRAQIISQDISPRQLNYLRSLPNLTHLDLDYTHVGNDGMAYVATLADLQWLDVEDTGITDEGLRKLSSLSSLRNIIVDGNEVTDAGLMHLAQVKSLQSIRLLNTGVTEQGVAQFNAQLPNCRVQIK